MQHRSLVFSYVRSRCSSRSRSSRWSILPPFTPVTLHQHTRHLPSVLNPVRQPSLSISAFIHNYKASIHILSLPSFLCSKKAKWQLVSWYVMMYLSAWFSWVPWGTPKAWGTLDACVATDTLDALSTWRPWLSWFTLRQRKDRDRRKRDEWNGRQTHS